ncbi:MAG: transrane protein 53 [Labilithrix sp.]|nr:transrane protein 53 [Labilithrix sp.]
MREGARVVLLGWGNAQPSQLAAYARLYRSLGLDAPPALSVIANTLEGLLRATAYPQAVVPLARELAAEPERPTLVHVFSDNGFVTWAALLETLAATAEGRRAREAIRGVVLDSAPGLWNVKGPSDFAWRFALAMTPALARRMKLGAREERSVLTPALAAAFLAYQLLFPGPVQRMIGSGRRVAEHQPRCPHLFMYGEDDAIVPPGDVRAWTATQEARGLEVVAEPFAGGRHVALFPGDPRRYKAALRTFTTRVLAP